MGEGTRCQREVTREHRPVTKDHRLGNVGGPEAVLSAQGMRAVVDGFRKEF